MRDILFRGKRLNNGKWAYGFLVKYPSAIQMPGYGGPWYISVPPVDPDDTGGCYNVDPATVGQYTGLTDRNGVKIFEGDIVKTSAFGVEDERAINHAGFDLFEVNFFDGGFRLENKWRLFNLRPCVEVEVIGNIYDNPELLGGDGK